MDKRYGNNGNGANCASRFGFDSPLWAIADKLGGKVDAAGLNGQIIVFENEYPPEDMTGTFTRTHFCMSTTGRYGFSEPSA